MRDAQRRRAEMDQQVITGIMHGTPAETLDEMRRQAPRRAGLIWASRIVLVFLAVLVFAFLALGWILYGGAL